MFDPCITHHHHPPSQAYASEGFLLPVLNWYSPAAGEGAGNTARTHGTAALAATINSDVVSPRSPQHGAIAPMRQLFQGSPHALHGVQV